MKKITHFMLGAMVFLGTIGTWGVSLHAMEINTTPIETQVNEQTIRTTTQSYDFKLEPGKNYEIKNTGTIKTQIKTDANTNKRYNTVVYKNDGTISLFQKGTTNSIYLEPGQKARVNASGSIGIQCVIESGQKDSIQIKEVDEPALHEFNLEPGKNYSIKNNNQLRIKIENNANVDKKYNYVQYKQDSSTDKFYKGTTNPMYLEAGEKIIANASGNIKVECYMPYTEKEKTPIEVIDHPALYEFNLGAGENYSIKNNNESRIKIENNANIDKKYNYVQYKQDSSTDKFYKGTTNPMYLEAGQKIIANASGNIKVECYMPYTEKEKTPIEVIDHPALYEFNLESGENYSIKNNNESRIKIENNANVDKKYNYVQYKQDSSTDKFYKGTTNPMYLEAGEKIIANASGNIKVECYMPYTEKEKASIENVKHPALYEFNIEPGRNYEIINNNESGIKIDNNANTDKKYNYIQYKQDTSLDKFYKGTTNPMYLGAKEKIVASASGNIKIECYIPYTEKAQTPIEEIDEPALYEFKLQGKTTYKIKNDNTERVKIENDANSNNKFNITYYNQSGNIERTVQNTTGPIYIDPQKSVEIYPLSEIGLNCFLPYPQSYELAINGAKNERIIRFVDKKLKQALINQKVDTNKDNIIRADEMRALTTLDINSAEITNLSGLEYAFNLVQLNLSNNPIENIEVLSNLIKLETLDINSCNMNEIGFLTKLLKLKNLKMTANNISDMTPVQNLINLEKLYINNCNVKNLKFTNKLSKLSHLEVANNQKLDIKGLELLKQLQVLKMSNCGVTEIEALKSLANLKIVDISNNKIKSIIPLTYLINLENLNIANCELRDIYFVENFSKLKALNVTENYLDIRENSSTMKMINRLINKGINVTYQVQKESPLSDFDLVKDGVINEQDIEELSKQHNQTSEDATFDPNVDYNKDGIIDLLDYIYISNKIK